MEDSPDPGVTVIPGITPSALLRSELAGQTVLLAFSRGKDSLAAWLALREAGATVIPYHMYGIPGLAFVEESLAYFADYFDCGDILQVPHPSLARKLVNFVFQPPERARTIEAANLPEPTYQDLISMIKEHHQLPADTWVCDGVRAADSPTRRLALSSYGPVHQRNRTMKIVWDWRKAKVMDTIRAAGVRLPVDYDWFGRSFDGIDHRFLGPLRTNAPADYRTVLDWFPLGDLEIARRALHRHRASGPKPQTFAERAARENTRFRLATDSEYWVSLCFREQADTARFASALGLTPQNRYIPGPRFTEAAAGRTPARNQATRARDLLAARTLTNPAARLNDRPPPNPLDAVDYTDHIGVDSIAELAALLAALQAPADPAPANVLDSPHWLIVYFPTRQDKETMLAATGLDVLGDKYLDGHQAARILNLTM